MAKGLTYNLAIMYPGIRQVAGFLEKMDENGVAIRTKVPRKPGKTVTEYFTLSEVAYVAGNVGSDDTVVGVFSKSEQVYSDTLHDPKPLNAKLGLWQGTNEAGYQIVYRPDLSSLSTDEIEGGDATKKSGKGNRPEADDDGDGGDEPPKKKLNLKPGKSDKGEKPGKKDKDKKKLKKGKKQW